MQKSYVVPPKRHAGDARHSNGHSNFSKDLSSDLHQMLPVVHVVITFCRSFSIHLVAVHAKPLDGPFSQPLANSQVIWQALKHSRSQVNVCRLAKEFHKQLQQAYHQDYGALAPYPFAAACRSRNRLDGRHFGQVLTFLNLTNTKS